jgi:serine/threonine-protein kinase
MRLHAGQQVDRYIVEGVLGVGGMAVVYAARHASLGTTVALKLLNEGGPTVTERAMSEGRVQASLRHPNVVACLDVIEVGGVPGLIMEWVDGEPLDRVLRRVDLTAGQVDALAQGILAGMAEAHASGIVHRDLKPANILLARGKDGPVPRVTDFGLVKLLERQLGDTPRTRTGATMGTPNYMAPEQYRDTSSVDARADVFSLGAVLYELATGDKAFPGTDLLTILDAIRADEPPRVPSGFCDLSEGQIDTIQQCMSAAPEDRPADAAELLARWLAARPAPLSGDTWTDFELARSEPDALDASDATWAPSVVEPADDAADLVSTLEAAETPSQAIDARSSAPRWALAFAGVGCAGMVAFAALGLAVGYAVFPDGSGMSPSRVALASALEAANAERDGELSVGLLPARAIGVDADTAAAVDMRIRGLLGSSVRVVQVSGDSTTEVLTAARRNGLDVVLFATIGLLADEHLFQLERMNVRTGQIDSSAYQDGAALDEVANLVDTLLGQMFTTPVSPPQAAASQAPSAGGGFALRGSSDTGENVAARPREPAEPRGTLSVVGHAARPATARPRRQAEIRNDIGSQAALIRAVVGTESPALATCYESTRREGLDQHIVVEVDMTIASGEVTDVAWADDTTVAPDGMLDCIDESIRGWRFPESVSSRIVWPFRFSDG